MLFLSFSLLFRDQFLGTALFSSYLISSFSDENYVREPNGYGKCLTLLKDMTGMDYDGFVVSNKIR